MDDRGFFEEKSDNRHVFTERGGRQSMPGFWAGFITAFLLIAVAGGIFWYVNKPILVPGAYVDGGLDQDEAEAILTKENQLISYIDKY